MPIHRFLIAVLLAISVATSAHAQRGGSHAASFSPHPTASFHNTPPPTTTSRPALQGYVPHSNASAARPQMSYRPASSPGVSAMRPAFYRGNRDRRPSPVRRGHVFYNGYGYPGYIGVNYLDFNSPYADDVSAAGVSNGDELLAPDQGPYVDQPSSGPAESELDAEPLPVPALDAVTLVYKDGHSSQIQNFIATRSSISVIQGQHHYDIAVTDLDLPATLKANREAGVDFALPGAAQ